MLFPDPGADGLSCGIGEQVAAVTLRVDYERADGLGGLARNEPHEKFTPLLPVS